MRLAVLITLILAFTAAPATAADWLPTFEHAAEQYWGHGTPPPCGQPLFQWVTPEVFSPTSTNLVTYGDANPQTCVIRFNVDTWHDLEPEDMCVLVVHELGHLYGHTHAEGGVMAPMLDQIDESTVRPCTSSIVTTVVCRRRNRDCRQIEMPARLSRARLT